MIEKGISRHEDRFAIIRFILDEFNSRLKAVASGFPNVTYINVLNTVRPDQWYDEIHPNSDGFQQVAMKFMQRINEVVAAHPDIVQPLNRDRGGHTMAKPPEKTRGRGITINTTNVEYERDPGRSSSPGAPRPALERLESSPAPLPQSPPAPASASGLREGQLEYDIPGSMKVNQQTACTVRIAGKEIDAALLKIGEDSVHQTITIGDEMSVRLIDSSGGECFKLPAAAPNGRPSGKATTRNGSFLSGH